MVDRKLNQALNAASSKGKDGDDKIGHLAHDELVIPVKFQQKYPGVMKTLQKMFTESGWNYNQYVVGNKANKINPSTGIAMFAEGMDGAGEGPGGGGGYGEGASEGASEGDGHGEGGTNPVVAETAAPAKDTGKIDETPAPTPVTPPTQTPKPMDLGAKNSIMDLSNGIGAFNKNFISTPTPAVQFNPLSDPAYGANLASGPSVYKRGGKVAENNSVGNALKIAMTLAEKMDKNPLLEEKIRSILLKL
jgi:hypothetical protein